MGLYADILQAFLRLILQAFSHALQAFFSANFVNENNPLRSQNVL
jgi:hypothetical protein